MTGASDIATWRWRRAGQIPREFFTGARLFTALALAFVVRSIAFFADELFGLPAGWAAISTLFVAAAFLLVVRASLPLELRSANLLELAVRPMRGELGRLPTVMRLGATAATAAVILPVLWVASDLSGRGAQADDATNLIARTGFVLVALYVVRRQLPGIWRRSRR